MLHHLVYHFKLLSLQRQKRRIDAASTKSWRQAKSDEERQEAHIGWIVDGEPVEEEIAILKSTYLQDCADRLTIPKLQYEENSLLWRRLQHSGQLVLSDQGMALQTDAIRNEERARREGRLFWLQIVTQVIIPTLAAVTGVIGALIGLKAG